MKREAAFLCVLLLASLCISSLGYDQSTDLGTIRGTVTDSAGASIAGAAVTITDS